MSTNVNSLPVATLKEYLTLDASSALRFEYVDGFIVAMAPPSFRHSKSTNNLSNIINAKLQGSDCEAYTSTIRILIEAANTRFYPDVVVICGEPTIVHEHGDSITNPSVIFEIISPDSKDFDPEEKRKTYQMLPSLNQYIVIEQKNAQISAWNRQGNFWRQSESVGMDGTLKLPSLKITLAIAEIYSGVKFD